MIPENLEEATKCYQRMISFTHRDIPYKTFYLFIKHLKFSKKFPEIIETFDRDISRVKDEENGAYALYMGALAATKQGKRSDLFPGCLFIFRLVKCLQLVKTKFPLKSLSENYNYVISYFSSLQDLDNASKLLQELIQNSEVPTTAWNREMELFVKEG
jgi:tetratricopeptide (TPR) repeat protein